MQTKTWVDNYYQRLSSKLLLIGFKNLNYESNKKIHDSELEYNIEKDEAIFCPNCGVKEVYVAIGEGDYYEGPPYFCKNCNNAFTLPSCGVDDTIKFFETVS